jgi:succinoglycan biosynthesis protein ExoW
MEADIAVIVPYFQEQPGILLRALRSVMAQRTVEDVNVVVVDDQSPISAESEVVRLGARPRFPVTIIHQSNGGPAAARNKGLESVPAATRYVAFLDSDDEWSDLHLARAVSALAQGFDFYFADLFQVGQTVSAFKRAGKIRPEEHPRLLGEDLFAYQGDMFQQIISGNVIGTPAVVYDFKRFPGIRLREEFLNAGEDYLCWMDFATQGARFAFSSRCEVTCGTGVNVYTGAGWGTEKHLLRVHNELRYRKVTLQSFRLEPAQRRFVTTKVRELRKAFARDLLHRIRHGQKLPWDVLKRQLRLDPATYLVVPPEAIRLVLERAKGRFDRSDA